MTALVWRRSWTPSPTATPVEQNRCGTLLEQRLQTWQTVVALVPPMTNLGDVFAPHLLKYLGNGAVPEEGVFHERASRSHGEDKAQSILVPSQLICRGDVRAEATFGRDWEAGQEIGISLLADREEGTGYDFVLCLRQQRFRIWDEPATADKRALSFETQRVAAGDFHLEIRRNGLPLVRQRIDAAQVPSGPLLLRATAANGTVQFQVNSLPALTFRDPFPILGTAGRDRVYGLRLSSVTRLAEFEAFSRQSKAAQSLLEKGDADFEAGDFENALEQYRLQALQTEDRRFEQESRYKQGLCLARLGLNEDAAAIWGPLIQEEGEVWPPLAGIQQWLLLVRQKQNAEADAVFELLSTRYRIGQLAALIPENVRHELVENYLSGVHRISGLLTYRPERLRDVQRAAAIDRFLSVDGVGNIALQAEVGRVLGLYGEFAEAEQVLRPLAEQTRHPVAIRHYLRCLRFQSRADEALAEANRLINEQTTASTFLLIDRAEFTWPAVSSKVRNGTSRS